MGFKYNYIPPRENLYNFKLGATMVTDYPLNIMYNKLVEDGFIEHGGYNTPFTACMCSDGLWNNPSYRGILEAVDRNPMKQCIVLRWNIDELSNAV